MYYILKYIYTKYIVYVPSRVSISLELFFERLLGEITIYRPFIFYSALYNIV